MRLTWPSTKTISHAMSSGLGLLLIGVAVASHYIKGTPWADITNIVSMVIGSGLIFFVGSKPTQ